MNPEVIILSTPEELAREAAQLMIESCRESIVRRAKWRVALTGGSSPVLLYKLLATPEYQAQIDWERTQVYFGDERAVGPDDERSNYRQASELLLSHVKAGEVFRMKGENPDLEAAAAEYAEQLGSEPLDCVLLGMGPDGHTASMFPGSPQASETERLCVATPISPTDPPCRRITLTFPALNAARLAFFTVAGGGKADLLARVLNGDEQYPSARVRLNEGRLVWFLDDAAASVWQKGRDV